MQSESLYAGAGLRHKPGASARVYCLTELNVYCRVAFAFVLSLISASTDESVFSCTLISALYISICNSYLTPLQQKSQTNL